MFIAFELFVIYKIIIHLSKSGKLFAWILLALNIYGVLFFIGEIHAIRLSPIRLSHNSLYIQIGLMKRITIPLELIQEIRDYEGPEKLNRKERKNVFEATVKDFFNEKPAIELILIEPIEVNYMYGVKKKVYCVLLNVDEKEYFKNTLIQKISK